ncbi:MAG: hypothetical protein ACLQO1_03870 [Steroidobacteraceae bacterium]
MLSTTARRRTGSTVQCAGLAAALLAMLTSCAMPLLATPTKAAITPGAAQSAEAGTASAPAEEFNYGRFAELAAVILRGLPVLSAQLLAP